MMIQDMYRNNKWKMLMCCIMLNRSKGGVVKKVAPNFFDEFESALSVINGDKDLMTKIIQPLGLQNERVNRMKDLSEWFINNKKVVTSDDLLGAPGVGDFTIESWSVFIDRIIPEVITDKEIRRYVQNAVKSSDIIRSFSKRIYEAGEFNTIEGMDYIEAINKGIEIYDNVFIEKLDEDNAKYVSDKMAFIGDQIDSAIKKIMYDRNSRRAIIVFNQDGNEQNCSVCSHIQIRNNKIIELVYQRSQDVDMLHKDIETYARIACRFCEYGWADEYFISIRYGNIHARYDA